MFSATRPDDEAIRLFLTAQQQLPYSYAEVGATITIPPYGYDVDHNRIQLGSGHEVFTRAKEAVRRWEMFNFGWLRLWTPAAPIAVDTTVAVLAHVWSIWILNACRIVYVVDDTGPVDIFGFAYGTLPGHVERGEERFTVQWHHADDSVWYNHWLTRLGYLYVRRLQKRFARASQQATLSAVSRASQPHPCSAPRS
jgi:uncharacterized protein (UPF0548 family)